MGERVRDDFEGPADEFGGRGQSMRQNIAASWRNPVSAKLIAPPPKAGRTAAPGPEQFPLR
jgi:hypothetical protein